MNSRVVFPLATGVILLISLALRIVYLDQRSLWFDEASSWQTAQLSPAELVDSLRQSTHVPLYYPILRAWMQVWGDSPIALRGFSVFFGILTIIGCGFLGRRVGHMPDDCDRQPAAANTFALFCAALCGFNAFQVLASVEARMYSLGTFLTVLSTLATLRAAEKPEDRSRWIALIAVTVASLYTHHFLALTAGIQAIWLLCMVWRPPGTEVTGRSRRNAIASIVVVALLWVPALLLWSIQLNRIHHDFWIGPMTFWSLPETCFDFFFAPPPGRRWDFHDGGIVTLAIVCLLLTPLRRRLSAAKSLLLAQAILPMLVIAMVSQHTPLWESRYFRFSHVSLLMCLAMSIGSLSDRLHMRTILCAAFLFVSLSGSLLFWSWRDVPNRQAVRGAMQMIRNVDMRTASPIVVTSPIDFIVTRYYAAQFRWPADRVRLWTGEDRMPGAAIHLIRHADWWLPNEHRSPTEPIWFVSSVNSIPSAPDDEFTPEYEFPSDTWLDHWSVQVVQRRRP